MRPAYERESDRLWGLLNEYVEVRGASRRRQAAHGTTSSSPSSKLIFTLSLLLLTAPTLPGYIWRFFHGAMTRTPTAGFGTSSSAAPTWPCVHGALTRTPGAATAPSCSVPVPLRTTRGCSRRRKFVKAVARGRARARWLMMSVLWPAPARRFMAVL